MGRKHILTKPFRRIVDNIVSEFTGRLPTAIVSTTRFLNILYWRFFQQILAYPNPDGNGVLSTTAKSGKRPLLCTRVMNDGNRVPEEEAEIRAVAVVTFKEPFGSQPVPGRYAAREIDSIEKVARLVEVRL